LHVKLSTFKSKHGSNCNREHYALLDAYSINRKIYQLVDHLFLLRITLFPQSLHVGFMSCPCFMCANFGQPTTSNSQFKSTQRLNARNSRQSICSTYLSNSTLPRDLRHCLKVVFADSISKCATRAIIHVPMIVKSGRIEMGPVWFFTYQTSQHLSRRPFHQ
jgi:hypothetical protein